MTHVTASVAISLDGYIDDCSPNRLMLSNQADWEAVDQLRAESDAILVGAKTIRAGNPRLLIKTEKCRQVRIDCGLSADPIKVTITRGGDLDPDFNFFAAGSCEKLVYCPEGTKSSLSDKLGQLATVIGCKGKEVSPAFVVEDLSARGVTRLLIEGGENIHTMFLKANMIDELRVAIAPVFVGDKNAPRFVGSSKHPQDLFGGMVLKSVEKIGDVAVLKYIIKSEIRR